MLPSIEKFKAPEHRSFHLPGVNGRAALLVHGFPGSPAEMRPLAEALHAAGWTVHAPLLPGFAAELETIFDRTHHEWAGTVHAALRELQAGHEQVLLIGHSMGAALSVRVCAEACAAGHPPHALIVSAPFWRLGNWAMQALWPLIRLFGKKLRPFRVIKLDFHNAEMRDGIRQWLGEGLDLDDPVVQEQIRDIEMPIGVFVELREAGRACWRSAPAVTTPTLVIQGLDDHLVTRVNTARFLNRLGAQPIEYFEVACDHDLVSNQTAAWPEIRGLVLAFAEKLTAASGQPSA